MECMAITTGMDRCLRALTQQCCRGVVVGMKPTLDAHLSRCDVYVYIPGNLSPVA